MNVCPRRRSPKIPLAITNPTQRRGSHTLVIVGSTDILRLEEHTAAGIIATW
jgi:hypothetical protein